VPIGQHAFLAITQAFASHRVYRDREKARRDVFDYIEMFYNPKRRHSYSNGLSPIDYKKQYEERLTIVRKIGGDSCGAYQSVQN
jgi:putative transposase